MLPIYNLSNFLEWFNQGGKPKYIFFWSHRRINNETISKNCLSQWYEASFKVNGISYSTSEQYMMAEKARLFCDDNAFVRILNAKNPGAVKAIGREVRNFEENVWNEHRLNIVITGNLAKFSQNPELKTYLLSTGNRILVEASPVDKIWGTGLAEDNPSIFNPNQWKGENLLGFALMDVRNELRK